MSEERNIESNEVDENRPLEYETTEEVTNRSKPIKFLIFNQQIGQLTK